MPTPRWIQFLEQFGLRMRGGARQRKRSPSPECSSSWQPPTLGRTSRRTPWQVSSGSRSRSTRSPPKPPKRSRQRGPVEGRAGCPSVACNCVPSVRKRATAPDREAGAADGRLRLALYEFIAGDREVREATIEAATLARLGTAQKTHWTMGSIDRFSNDLGEGKLAHLIILHSTWEMYCKNAALVEEGLDRGLWGGVRALLRTAPGFPEDSALEGEAVEIGEAIEATRVPRHPRSWRVLARSPIPGGRGERGGG